LADSFVADDLEAGADVVAGAFVADALGGELTEDRGVGVGALRTRGSTRRCHTSSSRRCTRVAAAGSVVIGVVFSRLAARKSSVLTSS
jgi:hypothetical protein